MPNKNCCIRPPSTGPWNYLPDIFGREVTLLYEGNTSHKTKCGIFGTLFIIIVFGTCFLSEMMRYFNQDVVSHEQIESIRTPRGSNFSGYIGVFQKDVVIEQEFIHMAILIEGVDDPSSYILPSQNLVFEVNCSSTKIYSEVPKYGIICYRVNSTSLKSDDIEPIFSISSCSTIDNTKCISMGGRLRYAIELDSNYMGGSLSKLSTKLKWFEYSIYPEFIKMQSISLIEHELTTISDLTQSRQGLRSYVLRSNLESLVGINSKQNSNNICFSIIVNCSPEIMIFSKQNHYQLKDAISFMGGLMKGLTMLIFLLVYPFREIIFYNSLVNQMFRICDTPDHLMKNFKSNRPEIFKYEPNPISHELPNNINRVKRQSLVTEISPQAIKIAIQKLESMKNRLFKGGLFYSIIREDKEKLVKEIEQEILCKFDSESAIGDIHRPLKTSNHIQSK